MHAAVIGDPVAHSLSPVLHHAAYRYLGLADWAYSAIRVPAGGLATFMTQLPAAEWAGVSVTMPHKTAAAQWASHRSELVDYLGVANTLIPSATGWQAHNTDVAGLVACFAQARRPVSALLLFGAGATAQSALVAAAQVGVKHVTVLVRDRQRSADFVALAQRCGVPVVVVDDPQQVTSAPDLLISTVPHIPAAAWWQQLPRTASWSATGGHPLAVLDVVYDPWPSPLVKAVRAGGGQVVDGVQMLLHQAIAQVALMTGQQVPAAALSRSLPSRNEAF